MTQQRKTEDDPRLRELELACPDCGAMMRGTGRMHYSETVGRWLAEFRCPADQELHEIWTPQVEKLSPDAR